MPGPPPKPAALKVIQGNPGRRPIDKNELAVPVHAPECPAHLIAEAKAEWERIIPQLLRFRLIAELDTASLSLYCQAYGRWQQAEKSIADMAAKTSGDGMLIKAPSGYPIQNPYLAIANRAMEDCNKYLQAFGLSPSARAKVTPANQQLELFAGTSEWSSL